jgi:hypothetical protein
MEVRGDDGNNKGGRQQQCLSSSNQKAIKSIRKHKKAHKNTAINVQNGGGRHVWLLEMVPMVQG